MSVHLVERSPGLAGLRVPGQKVDIQLEYTLDVAHEVVGAAKGEAAAPFHEQWQAEKKNLPLSDAVISAVEGHVRKIPLASKVNAA